jgi:hypothetical protein
VGRKKKTLDRKAGFGFAVQGTVFHPETVLFRREEADLGESGKRIRLRMGT